MSISSFLFLIICNGLYRLFIDVPYAALPVQFNFLIVPFSHYRDFLFICIHALVIYVYIYIYKYLFYIVNIFAQIERYTSFFLPFVFFLFSDNHIKDTYVIHFHWCKSCSLLREWMCSWIHCTFSVHITIEIYVRFWHCLWIPLVQRSDNASSYLSESDEENKEILECV